ncbi:MAG: DMT family transporter [Erysipelotrichaceae bacterium]|nr:DMT family transporter [Erysipelotrichaceae bacterium]
MTKQKANLCCLIVAFIWGGGFVATEMALTIFTPFAMLLIRFVGAAILAWIPVLVTKEKLTKDALKIGMVSGVMLFLAFAFQTVGLSMTTAGMNAFLTACNVVFVPFIVWTVYRKKPDMIVFVASLLCLVGIGCLSLNGGGFHLGMGDILTLICAFFFGAQIVSLYRAGDCNVWVLNAVQLTTAAVCAIPLGLMTTWPAHIGWTGIWTMFYSIVLATFVCYLLQTIAQQYTTPAATSILLATESLWGNLLSIMFLHEPTSAIMLIGGLLIFSSVILVEGQSWITEIFKRKKAEVAE